MSAADLTPILWFLTACAWVSFALFVWAAFDGPNIVSLSERTFVAFVLATLGTVASLLRYNTDTGFSLFPQQTAALIFAMTMLATLAIPTVWLVLMIGVLVREWRRRRRFR